MTGMTRHTVTRTVLGPWSLAISRDFWEGFAPAALPDLQATTGGLRTVFRVEADWSAASATVTQDGATATIAVEGDGDLDAAAAQVGRFLSLDVDATGWPAVGERDPVIADAQRRLPGLRPCGFHSPYEAAAWSVLSQRIRIVQAAKLRQQIIDEHGDGGAFPAPGRLLHTDLDLPGRKTEYLQSVCAAALDGRLDGATLQQADPDRSVAQLQDIKGIGPFAAELIVLRGANAPDALPHAERRLDAEIVEKYGPDADLTEIAEAWRPFRTWACVHLRALREERTGEIGGRRHQV
jgi:DNA-3-methyladenine glycosylase II